MEGIRVVLMDMPTQIKGHVCANDDGGYTIFINARMNSEQQKLTCVHELKHIFNNDFELHDVNDIERGMI